MPFFDAAYAAGNRPLRLADADPDLLLGCGPGAAGVTLTTIRLAAGRCTTLTDEGQDARALLIVEGVLARTVRVGTQSRSELLGEGDVLCPRDGEHAVTTIECSVRWEVLQPARIALLDHEFFASVARWPTIAAALTARGVRRSHRLAVQLAIADLRRIDERVVALLLHLGDRWGRMTPDGIHVPLRLTHDLLAQLLGAQRPTVTTSLNDLQRRGALLRRSDRTWIVRSSAGTTASAA